MGHNFSAIIKVTLFNKKKNTFNRKHFKIQFPTIKNKNEF